MEKDRCTNECATVFFAWELPQSRIRSTAPSGMGPRPLSLALLDSSPKGRASGEKIQHSDFAKASPFRERWHGVSRDGEGEPPSLRKTSPGRGKMSRKRQKGERVASRSDDGRSCITAPCCAGSAPTWELHRPSWQTSPRHSCRAEPRCPCAGTAQRVPPRPRA